LDLDDDIPAKPMMLLCDWVIYLGKQICSGNGCNENFKV